MGSNLGDSRHILEEALVRLECALGPLVVAPIYLTEPVSPIPQPPYLNTVAIGASGLSAERLLALTQQVELDFGRLRTVPEAPRTLDIDLLLLDGEVRAEAAPLLPHPRLRNRRFVLAPLCDVAPDWEIPPDGATACELLRRLPTSPWARRLPHPSGSADGAPQRESEPR
ncbi:MAG: 2-amino-4-hydroxy-6-hydroxymethyldihydropteridine diphosphokinase [Thermoanaerobaculia bacterium]